MFGKYHVVLNLPKNKKIEFSHLTRIGAIEKGLRMSYWFFNQKKQITQQ